MQVKIIEELLVDSVRAQTQSVAGGSLTKVEAHRVFAMDYKARMQEALGKNYESTCLVLGDGSV